MSKLAFHKLNITKELPVKTINFNGTDIEVKQYLDLNSKQNIIDMAIDQVNYYLMLIDYYQMLF